MTSTSSFLNKFFGFARKTKRNKKQQDDTVSISSFGFDNNNRNSYFEVKPPAAKGIEPIAESMYERTRPTNKTSTHSNSSRTLVPKKSSSMLDLNRPGASEVLPLSSKPIYATPQVPQNNGNHSHTDSFRSQIFDNKMDMHTSTSPMPQGRNSKQNFEGNS